MTSAEIPLDHNMPDLPDPEPVDHIPDPKPTAYDRITAHRNGAKQPILADWLRETEARTAILRWFVGYCLHIAAYHAVRIPTTYQWKLLTRAPVGAARMLRAIVDGVTDAEARPLRKGAVHREDSKEYLALVKERNARIHRRLVALAVFATITGALLVVLLLLANTLVMALATLVVVDTLGYVGRRYDEPLISKATTPQHIAPVLRQEAVEIAIRALPGGIVKKDARIEFPDPIHRDGPGYLAIVRLPHGVTPAKVMSMREELASGLRRPLGSVWPESSADEDGSLLRLWVGYQAMSVAKQPPWPYVRSGQVDLFRSVPYGTDNRMRKVGIELIENNVLIGAMPGAGKTAAMRTLLLGCALDPTAELRIWELKGSGDLTSLEKVAHTYGSGQDDATIEACVLDLEAVAADIERRAAEVKRLAKNSRDLVPDNKTTRALANNRQLGLHPLVVAIDEVQNLYSHERFGDRAEAAALRIIRMGRAFGVILIQATQRPDKDALPKAISAQAGIRICLRVMGFRENDMVLGDGMSSKGIAAQTLGMKDKGVGYLVGVRDDPFVARSYYLDGVLAEAISERARRVREAEDRLTGYAAGQLDPALDAGPGFDLLADVRQVMVDQSVSWMWNVSAAGSLAVLRPDVYAGWDAEMVGKALARRGVQTRQMNRTDADGERRNLVGFELEQINSALAAGRTLSLVK